ncbi:hypothetical protein GGP41_002055 [Bipolaris sorokiniana]|uniref:Uncharacterized protein n=1 Tax=Cochliobolus sativus TaxID=45130 RepID=A0A8H5ZQJ5_COCSA|nr:hypothetical protein GGP41_002055 [Bipolaris sorokiniana]
MSSIFSFLQEKKFNSKYSAKSSPRQAHGRLVTKISLARGLSGSESPTCALWLVAFILPSIIFIKTWQATNSWRIHISY